MVVTWGANTVHTFAPPAPSATGGTFGAAAPSPGGLFGSPATTPAPAPAGGLFGSSTPAPAPAAGGLFGSTTPAPAPGGLFGSSTAAPTPAPASGGGLFGAPSASPAPAPGGLFGTPAPTPGGLFSTSPAPASGGLFSSTPAPSSGSLFSTTPSRSAFGTTSLFGTPAPAPPGTPFGSPPPSAQKPAQAALQAHYDASARQEAARILSALEKLHSTYTGTAAAVEGKEDQSKFITIVYTEITPEQRQLQWVHTIGSTTPLPVAPPRPPQVSEKEWHKAVVNNPDPQNYMPLALIGADALMARVSWQQDRAAELAKSAAVVRSTLESLQQRSVYMRRAVEQANRAHEGLRKRLLDVMRKVELARCMNHPLQPDEVQAMERLSALLKNVEKLRGTLLAVQETARRNPTAPAQVAALPDRSQLLQALTEQREGIKSLNNFVQRDLRDVSLIQQRVVEHVPQPPPRR